MKSLDLFAGIGGWSLAAEAAGIETVAACEIDAWKRAQFALHFPGVRLYRDVRKLTAKRLKADGCGSVDFVLASPPCQDASAANHCGKGIDGDDTKLAFEAVRLIDEIRPHGAVLENSPRLRTRGVDRLLLALEAIHYTVWPLVVGAIHGGAPHLRQRVWLVAADADRAGLWDQQGWSGGARRLGLAEPADHVNANGEGQSRLSFDAEMGGRSRADGTRGRGRKAETPADALGVGRGRGSRQADADGRQSSGGDQDHRHFPDRQSLAVGEGLGCHDGAQLAALQRAVHGGWRDGPASLARHLRVGDGIPSTLAADCRSAFGDAIVPQVGTAILKALIAAQAEMTRLQAMGVAA